MVFVLKYERVVVTNYLFFLPANTTEDSISTTANSSPYVSIPRVGNAVFTADYEYGSRVVVARFRTMERFSTFFVAVNPAPNPRS